MKLQLTERDGTLVHEIDVGDDIDNLRDAQLLITEARRRDLVGEGFLIRTEFNSPSVPDRMTHTAEEVVDARAEILAKMEEWRAQYPFTYIENKRKMLRCLEDMAINMFDELPKKWDTQKYHDLIDLMDVVYFLKHGGQR